MKRYINNKVYDTDRARLIGNFENGFLPNDPNYIKESLYQKKTGEFFLYCVGGENSKYYKAVKSTNEIIDEFIKPLVYADAEKWAKDNLRKEDYDSVFGAIVEDDSRVQMGIFISKTNADKLRKRSAELGMGISEYIEALIDLCDNIWDTMSKFHK